MTTPADDTVLRLALALWVADARAVVTPGQRAWVVDRLQQATADGQHVPLSALERARLKEPLLAYLKEFTPRIVEIVAAQFTEDREAHARRTWEWTPRTTEQGA